MKKLILAASLILTFAHTVQAFDQTGKNALGITGGFNIPVGAEQFKNEADGGVAYGFYGRHHFNESMGIDLAYTRQEYTKICSCTSSDIFDVLGFYRMKGAEDVTPVFGLGLGFVDNGANQSLHLGVRLRAGVEKALPERNLALGFMLDYQSISKMIGANRGPVPSNIATITPKLELTWYYGK
jgi:hypothetical protein